MTEATSAPSAGNPTPHLLNSEQASSLSFTFTSDGTEKTMTVAELARAAQQLAGTRKELSTLQTAVGDIATLREKAGQLEQFQSLVASDPARVISYVRSEAERNGVSLGESASAPAPDTGQPGGDGWTSQEPDSAVAHDVAALQAQLQQTQQMAAQNAARLEVDGTLNVLRAKGATEEDIEAAKQITVESGGAIDLNTAYQLHRGRSDSAALAEATAKIEQLEKGSAGTPEADSFLSNVFETAGAFGSSSSPSLPDGSPDPSAPRPAPSSISDAVAMAMAENRGIQPPT